MSVSEEFAEKLKHLREVNGLSQSQLADKLKVSRGSISFYENAERIPDIEFLDRVHEFFNVPFDYLLGYTENLKYENVDVGVRFHLSDKAIDNLDNSINPYILNSMLEQDEFCNFTHMLYNWADSYRFSLYSMEYKSPMIYERYNEFIKYEFAMEFMKIIANISNLRKADFKNWVENLPKNSLSDDDIDNFDKMDKLDEKIRKLETERELLLQQSKEGFDKYIKETEWLSEIQDKSFDEVEKEKKKDRNFR